MTDSRHAFSLVEIAVALGVIAFGLLTVVALLPLGMKNNHESAEETRAATILTALIADLSGTHPGDPQNPGKSRRFNLKLPYELDGQARITTSSSLEVNTLSAEYTTGLTSAEVPVPTNSSPLPNYQASVVYTRLPSAGTLAPVEARLIVNWPCLNTTDPGTLTNPGRIDGFVEAYVTFPAP